MEPYYETAPFFDTPIGCFGFLCITLKGPSTGISLIYPHQPIRLQNKLITFTKPSIYLNGTWDPEGQVLPDTTALHFCWAGCGTSCVFSMRVAKGRMASQQDPESSTTAHNQINAGRRKSTKSDVQVAVKDRKVRIDATPILFSLSCQIVGGFLRKYLASSSDNWKMKGTMQRHQVRPPKNVMAATSQLPARRRAAVMSAKPHSLGS